MTDLSILCVTRMGAHARRFLGDMEMLADGLGVEFVLCVDADPTRFDDLGTVVSRWVRSDGYIESVLDEAIAQCSGEYVLRLDDDECVSVEMARWLEDRSYRADDHWAFPRMHLWPDGRHYITNPPLWPDLQTRLSVQAKAGGRTVIHAGSPYGTGQVAEVAIEHHKFLVRDRAEREALLAEYEAIMPGANAWAPFSVPEMFAAQLQTREVGC